MTVFTLSWPVSIVFDAVFLDLGREKVERIQRHLIEIHSKEAVRCEFASMPSAEPCLTVESLVQIVEQCCRKLHFVGSSERLEGTSETRE